MATAGAACTILLFSFYQTNCGHAAIKPYLTMMQDFHPFTQDAFKKQTGLTAHDHEGVYLRWVNVQLNYQNYLSMKSMNEQLTQLVQVLKDKNSINV